MGFKSETLYGLGVRRLGGLWVISCGFGIKS